MEMAPHRLHGKIRTTPSPVIDHNHMSAASPRPMLRSRLFAATVPKLLRNARDIHFVALLSPGNVWTTAGGWTCRQG